MDKGDASARDKHRDKGNRVNSSAAINSATSSAQDPAVRAKGKRANSSATINSATNGAQDPADSSATAESATSSPAERAKDGAHSMAINKSSSNAHGQEKPKQTCHEHCSEAHQHAPLIRACYRMHA